MNFISENQIYKLIEDLYPICRSITGDGVRETLRIVSEEIPLEIKEIPTGTNVFDWTIPKEWNINDAYILDSKGNKVVDFQNSNLHIVNYSVPINKKFSLQELKKHLFTIPNHPEWIPYKTAYYNKDWGFCLSYKDYLNLKEDTYEVVIDSKLTDGALTYGEFYIKGSLEEEVLISTHICHPSMCNDNLSGISIAVHLAKYLLKQKRRYSYRIIFVPATIGAITWLAINENNLSNIKFGLVAALLGDNGKFNYKRSRNGNSMIDKITEYTLMRSNFDFILHDFSPYGYDERQYCSPGINLPLGTLMRTPNKQFPEYHTSADDLEFIKRDKLGESFKIFCDIVNAIENNDKYLNLYPKCEPQLGKRDIYNSVAGNINEVELAILWVLNFSDGEHDLIDISIKSKLSIDVIKSAAMLLTKHKLVQEII